MNRTEKASTMLNPCECPPAYEAGMRLCVSGGGERPATTAVMAVGEETMSNSSSDGNAVDPNLVLPAGLADSRRDGTCSI